MFPSFVQSSTKVFGTKKRVKSRKSAGGSSKKVRSDGEAVSTPSPAASSNNSNSNNNSRKKSNSSKRSKTDKESKSKVIKETAVYPV